MDFGGFWLMRWVMMWECVVIFGDMVRGGVIWGGYVFWLGDWFGWVCVFLIYFCLCVSCLLLSFLVVDLRFAVHGIVLS